jgi:hypothetical protein
MATPTCHLTAMSPIALTAPQRSQREIATPDDDLGGYQFPSHQLELPIVLMQGSKPLPITIRLRLNKWTSKRAGRLLRPTLFAATTIELSLHK